MDDNQIIELLFARTETALNEISSKYSRLYCSVIRNVLHDESDVHECENDVLLAVWNSIPPHKPNSLSAYLCKLARRISIDRLRYNTRKKRNAEYTILLSELNDCLPAKEITTDHQEQNEHIRTVFSDFVRSLEPETQILFLRRYIYLEPVNSLAERFQMNENYVSVKLYRARKKLKKLLEKEGIRV